MDKYTVDLDQVLNDFEYSELTDYNGRQHQTTTTTTTTQTTNNYNKTTPTPTTTTTKHSINNVFHSLNEYLNSDIKTIDNLPNRNQLDVDDNKIVQDKVEIDDDEKKPDGNDTNEKKILEENNETNESIDGQDNRNIEQIEEAENETIEANHTEEERQNDEITNNNNSNNDSINQQPTSINNEEDNIISNKEDEEEINEEIIETTDNINEEVLLEKHQDIEEINETIDDKTIEDQTIQVGFDDKTIQVGFDNKTIEGGFDDKTIEDKTIEVGFNDDIEIDEGELNQYLEQLELEYESQQQQQQQEEEIKEEPTAERPKELTLEEGEKKIDLVGAPGSTPFNNVYIDKELEQKSGSDTSDDDDDETTASISDVSTAELNQDELAPEPPQQIDEEEEDSEISTETFHDAVETQPTTSQQQSTDNNNDNDDWLGNQAPLWIPDNVATNCLHCDMKFTVIKRRHHCRACGLVLCSKCCYLKLKLKYLDDLARVCNKCYEILTTKQQQQPPSTRCKDDHEQQQPNPNNPAEYCSTIPPHQQVTSSGNPVPSVMVPVGVLKRKNGTNSANNNNNNNNSSSRNKSVMFCDGIRPGSDLTNLDNDFSYQQQSKKQLEQQHPVIIDKGTKSFLTTTTTSTIKLPPIVKFNKNERIYEEFNQKNFNNDDLLNHLKENLLIFAININLFINLRIVNLNCCINKFVWCFITNGLINVGQDEIVILLELLDNEIHIPLDIFHYINNVYLNAIKGVTIKEMDLALNQQQQQQDNGNFLDSKNHAGFLFIRPTFQCLQNLNDLLPQEPYLIGILIHRWETPWAKLFPLRLLLRLGAEYRYYPCPIISYRYRNSCFVEIGHTIINLLADFRNFTYTLPKINGLYITMEEKITKILIPKNRYKQIIKTINNSSDHILAFGGNFSTLTDSHLVCIQDVQNNENSYTTHAINIHNKPRKLTGASFIVFNGALKSSSGLTAKSSIVEDGLMIQITPDHMLKIRDDLRNMKNHTIQCGCINSKTDEIVEIIWTEPDTNFNLNVKSPIDNQPLNGIPSIRVHNGKDYINNNGQRLIRWTEVFILKNSDGDCIDNENDLITTIDNGRNDPVDISKISESIAKATCNALVKYLDLLISNNFYKIGIRTTLHVENVSYLAGSNNMKLPPIYMKSLDNELIPVLHRITSNNFNDHNVVLELFFRILNK